MTSPLIAPPGAFTRLRALARAARQLAAGLVLQSGKDGPPDLDELWRDFNRKLGGLFGGKGGAPRGNGSGNPGDGGGPNFQPDMKSAGIGVGLIIGVYKVPT